MFEVLRVTYFSPFFCFLYIVDLLQITTLSNVAQDKCPIQYQND